MHRYLLLLQAVSAKFCHDMANSIGTVDNALSLLDNNNDEIANKSENLAKRESGNLVSKIKFYRAAYGLFEEEDRFSAIKLFSLANNLFDRSKLKFVPRAAEGVICIDSLVAKSIMCLLVIVAESNIYGGELELFIPKDDELEPIIVRSAGTRIVTRDERICILQNFSHDYPINSLNCREHYVKELCLYKNYRLELERSRTVFEVKLFKQKS